MKNINADAIEKMIPKFLEAIGADINSNSLKETPQRVAKMCVEIFEGMQYTNDEIANMFNKCFEVSNHNLVLEKNIPIFSFCEHHLALMYNMVVHVAYIPDGHVIGLSKISRIADMVGKRLQLQERIGEDIADILEQIVKINDIMIIIESEHSCVSIRGIKKRGSITRTITSRGKFNNDTNLRKEVLLSIKG